MGWTEAEVAALAASCLLASLVALGPRRWARCCQLAAVRLWKNRGLVRAWFCAADY